jgi:hypothetical protein
MYNYNCKRKKNSKKLTTQGIAYARRLNKTNQADNPSLPIKVLTVPIKILIKVLDNIITTKLDIKVGIRAQVHLNHNKKTLNKPLNKPLKATVHNNPNPNPISPTSLTSRVSNLAIKQIISPIPTEHHNRLVKLRHRPQNLISVA